MTTNINERIARDRKDLEVLCPPGWLEVLEREALGLRRPIHIVAPPGVARIMIARRAVSLLPRTWSDVELATYASLRTMSHGTDDPIGWLEGFDWADDIPRPFRTPHHTVRWNGMIGAKRAQGAYRPGEVARAHGGVLLLDCLPEFPRAVIAGIGGVLARGGIDVAFPEPGASLRSVLFPTRPWVITTSHPCPCGWATYGPRECTCPERVRVGWQPRIREYREMLDNGKGSIVLEWPRGDDGNAIGMNPLEGFLTT